MRVVFDIGGTKTRLAASHDGESFDDPVIIDTPKHFEEAVERFREITHSFAKGESIEALAGGIRGALNRDRTTLLSEIYLTDWVGRPIKETLESACAAPVYLENDTALVGLGEAVVGAGSGHTIVAYVTVSTGVGGVRIVQKKLDEVALGFEPGKQIIDADKTLCPDCAGNTLEHYVSGMHVEARFGTPPYEITDEKVWHQLSEFFAIGLLNTIVHWSPDIVVLGGSMVLGDPALFLDDIRQYIAKQLTVFPEVPRITKATLGDTGGLHGGLAYLREQLHT